MSDAPKIKILAVDDEPDGLYALEQLLLLRGYSVVTASSGSETLEKARDERPDLILLDVMMPEPNGYQVAKILKGDPDLRYIPMVNFERRRSRIVGSKPEWRRPSHSRTSSAEARR
jgi:CheY-like chemotaxis protein